MRPSANLLLAQEAKEGDFRKGMLRFGQSKTEIAAMQGSQNEKKSLLSKIDLVLWYQVRLAIWDSLITFCSRVRHP